MAEHASELVALLGVVFMLLIGVLAWIGSRVHSRLDLLNEIVDRKFSELHEVMGEIKDDLHSRITGIGERVAKLESRCEVTHRDHA